METREIREREKRESERERTSLRERENDISITSPIYYQSKDLLQIWLRLQARNRQLQGVPKNIKVHFLFVSLHLCSSLVS